MILALSVVPIIIILASCAYTDLEDARGTLIVVQYIVTVTTLLNYLITIAATLYPQLAKIILLSLGASLHLG